jgi:mono/diheme cytochrome c family protein
MKSNLLFVTALFLIYSCHYSTQPYKEGKKLYEFHCASCHGTDGEGLGDLYPALKFNPHIQSNRNNLACWIYYGIAQDKPNSVTEENLAAQEMPSFKYLDPIEITNILNYVNSRFWQFEEFNLKEVSKNISDCTPD